MRGPGKANPHIPQNTEEQCALEQGLVNLGWVTSWKLLGKNLPHFGIVSCCGGHILRADSITQLGEAIVHGGTRHFDSELIGAGFVNEGQRKLDRPAYPIGHSTV